MLFRRKKPKPVRRCSGILMHPTSLPGAAGVGDLGVEARRFIDWLAAAGQSLWQILPLGPTDGSPYSSSSAFAGNPALLDLEELGSALPERTGEGVTASAAKIRALREVFERSGRDTLRSPAFAEFRTREAGWLDDYALFAALHEAHDHRSWLDWPAPLARRERGALAAARAELSDARAFHEFAQFCFDRQWRALRAYAQARGVRIVGDVPFYVALDSADVWANPDLFVLDPTTRRPLAVAGVPPDAFSDTGQLWGFPIYAWSRMRRTRFRWWVQRFARLARLVDIVRIDHFRGFAAYWSVPAGQPTAEHGTWVKAPGRALFQQAFRKLPHLDVWAEDLGHITPDVHQLRDRFDLPSMRVLQFAFDGSTDNEHLPFHHGPRSVIYTGTHDNDTTRGWWASLDADTQDRVAGWFEAFDDREVHWHLTRLAFGSVANQAIIPLQDAVGLGSEARMNIPGTPEGNWTWRVEGDALDEALAARLAELTKTYGRSRD